MLYCSYKQQNIYTTFDILKTYMFQQNKTMLK